MSHSSDDPARRCRFAWCTTDHGATLHPDDEAHRSIGVAVPLRVRVTGSTATAHNTVAEIGLHRRLDDDETWLTVDDGRLLRYDVTVSSVRAALQALDADPAAQHELRGET